VDNKSKPTKDRDPQGEFLRPPIENKESLENKESRWGFRGMSVRDWLPIIGALLIPVVIAAGTGWITWQQGKIEDQRAKAERELAEQRAQDEALQAYLDQMSSLLLEKDQRASEVESEVHTLARARTLTVLERLDPSRKTQVMRFLLEAELVQSVDGKPPLIRLQEADLHGVVFTNASLNDANLHAADLRHAVLVGADLREADLREANLNSTYLFGVDLHKANLNDTSGVSKEQLKQQASSLEGATMPGTIVIPARGEISAGKYVSDEFEPALSFMVGTSWKVVESETTEQLMISSTGPERGELIFTSPLHVFDPDDLLHRKEVPAPENADEWISWFQRHPHLDVSKPVPVSVGGEAGMQIDVTTPTSMQEDCGGGPCVVPLFPTDTGEEVYLIREGMERFVIVDLGGGTVVIDIHAPVDKFDEFHPEAINVLKTVEWKGG
jgi:Pentapeptide repeats (8 copies)